MKNNEKILRFFVLEDKINFSKADLEASYPNALNAEIEILSWKNINHLLKTYVDS